MRRAGLQRAVVQRAGGCGGPECSGPEQRAVNDHHPLRGYPVPRKGP
jgi:hypothetical protein